MCLVFLIERDRVVGHVDGGPGVTVHNTRPVKRDAKSEQEITNEQDLASSQHSTKVLSLGAGQGHRALHLREPEEEAPVIEYEAPAARELHRPGRVDVSLHASVGIRCKHKGAILRAAQVKQDTKTMHEMGRARVGEETG